MNIKFYSLSNTTQKILQQFNSLQVYYIYITNINTINNTTNIITIILLLYYIIMRVSELLTLALKSHFSIQ